jgi:hypothetical protein
VMLGSRGLNTARHHVSNTLRPRNNSSSTPRHPPHPATGPVHTSRLIQATQPPSKDRARQRAEAASRDAESPVLWRTFRRHVL